MPYSPFYSEEASRGVFLQKFRSFLNVYNFLSQTLTNNTLYTKMLLQMPPVKRAFSWLNRISSSQYTVTNTITCQNSENTL